MDSLTKALIKSVRTILEAHHDLAVLGEYHRRVRETLLGRPYQGGTLSAVKVLGSGRLLLTVTRAADHPAGAREQFVINSASDL